MAARTLSPPEWHVGTARRARFDTTRAPLVTQRMTQAGCSMRLSFEPLPGMLKCAARSPPMPPAPPTCCARPGSPAWQWGLGSGWSSMSGTCSRCGTGWGGRVGEGTASQVMARQVMRVPGQARAAGSHGVRRPHPLLAICVVNVEPDDVVGHLVLVKLCVHSRNVSLVLVIPPALRVWTEEEGQQGRGWGLGAHMQLVRAEPWL